jgi:hypothetical protein
MLPLALAALVAADTSPLIAEATVKGGRLVAVRSVVEFQTVTKTRQVKVNGEAKTEVFNEQVPVKKSLETTWDFSKAKVSDGEGNKLSPKAVARQLRKPAVVAVSGDGNPVPAAHLKLLKKDAIVVVAPVVGHKPVSPEPPDKKAR